VKPVLLVRNDTYESFGLAPSALAWAGMDLVTANLPAGAELPPIDHVGGVVMFGGTQNVDQVERFPYLGRARAYTADVINAGVPFLGICLGCQILVRALGQPVPKAPVKECGFEAIRPTAEGKEDRLLSQYTDGDLVVQWHEDTASMPPEATLLATSDAIEVQALRIGDRAWGIQFHQEVDAAEFGWWLDIADAEMDLAATWGKSAERLREESAHHMAANEERGRELFRRFAEVVRESS
jgi:GMP synthase-like glutamine amidotransferase